MTAPAAIRADALLDDIWYFAALSRDIRRGRLVRSILFAQPIVFGRTKAGEAFALADQCPHRGAPLSAGHLSEDGAIVACPYHGWRFRVADGACAGIPALMESSAQDIAKIRIRRFALHEENGILWIYWPKPSANGGSPGISAPDIGLPRSFRPKIVVREKAEGPYDEAVIGLVDPAHTPFVHRQWWWREGAGLKDKTKNFEPTPFGFKMPAHAPSSNSRIYKFLGRPTTEIEFRLPGVRLETVRAGRRTILSLTMITPTETGQSAITHVIYWDLPMLTLLQPIVQEMAESFLEQDAAILRAQNMNLARAPHRPLYVGDPDEPAKWYLRLKRAWVERAAGEPFVNPIAGATLHWRT